MQSYERITIHRMIVHKVDHINFDEPQLSDVESPTDDRDVQFFLKRHIANSKEHRYARSGIFIGASNDESLIVEETCNSLLSSPDEFVAHSKAIADHLFETVKSNKTISPGELVVATFSDGRKDGPQWLALLKMDPEDGFVGERQKVKGGVRIVLRRVPNVLPNSELQKCAFILPKRSRTSKRHLIVLDQQTARRGARRMVATFFVSNFLQCKVDLNKKEKTNAFIFGSFDFSGSKKGVWAEEQRERLETRVMEALQSSPIDVEVVARGAIQGPVEQDEYIEYVRKQMQVDGFEDLVFEPDPDLLNQQEYLVIEGDDELKIRILADAVGANKTLSYTVDEATNTHNVMIRTAEWKAVRVRGKR